MKKAILLWSGGKDSCVALHELRRGREFDVVGVLATCTEPDDRVSMHAVPLALIQQQAARIGLPLRVVRVPRNPSNPVYEERMSHALLDFRANGIELIAAGDIFLEDLREYRERQFKAVGLTGLFPLWKRNTKRLVHDFITSGFKAITVCINSRALGQEFIGRIVDEEFVGALPPQVDACGENGEFHTFVFDGPLFASPINFTRGAVTFRDPFRFCEVLP